jgi:signal transduction histidine kinase/CheY-like chemotaxis protein
MKRRSIAVRYAVLVAALLAVALIVSGALAIWSSHRDRQAIAESLQRDKARTAAVAVGRFLEDVQRSLQWATLSVPIAGGASPEQQRLELIKLLRLEPAITTVTLIDAKGAERLQVSRITPDRLASGADWSHHPGFATARAGGTYFSSTYFAAQSEPYLTIAAPAATRDGSVVAAEVNLKFVSTVVSELKIGATGYAYVVDARGRLVSHPDISLVLQMSDMSSLPQVQAAGATPGVESAFHTAARDLAGTPVFAAHAAIEPVSWTVFVEQPRAEALAPLAASIVRTALILATALVLALVIGVFAARRMVAPIAALRSGALRFGAGELDHRIDVASGDELQDLAAQFNAMADQLREIYADLERRVMDRTHELRERNDEITEALEQQTATAGILRVISSSPTDARPVFQTIVENAARLCHANFAFVMLDRDGWLSLAARTDCTPEFATYLEEGFPADRTTTTGRAVMARRPVQVLDFASETEVLVTPAHRSEQVRTVLAVPLLRDERVFGVIAVWRREVRAFSEKQITLLETFADQAVIAIENLRMFDELQARTRELSAALEYQTATGDVLNVISRSPTQLQIVLDTIVNTAARLCAAEYSYIAKYEGSTLRFVAHVHVDEEHLKFLADPINVDRGAVIGRVVLEGRTVHVHDVLADPEFDRLDWQQIGKQRTVLGVPLRREGTLIGVIILARTSVAPFTEKQIELVTTFADQAVIAIENARMFDQIQQTSRELALANQAKSRFLAAASHDLRQPMHALALFAAQLSSARTPVERAALIERVEKAAGSLSELLDQLLDLSKLEAGAVQAVLSDFPVRNLLAEIEVQFAPLAQSKGLSLRVHPSFAWLRSDEMLVRRILLNLVGNAVRYTQRGGVLIGCRRRGDRLRIGVWDTGCGIPGDRREDVFHEFVQLDPMGSHAPAERGHGLGLGLAIVARTAELLGTRVELRSAVGRGSMFAFELPLGVPSATAHPSPEPLRIAGLRGTFALVIDDDEAARAATCGLLESWGCLILAASDASEAIAQLSAHDRPPEIVICDYWLGTPASGLQAIHHLRAVIGEDLPAVLVTADMTKSLLSDAGALGVPLLHKPVSPVRLRALLVMLLAKGGGQRVAA